MPRNNVETGEATSPNMRRFVPPRA